MTTLANYVTLAWGQNCNHLHTAGNQTMKTQQRRVAIECWMLYLTRYDETCVSWFVFEIIPSWLNSISELRWARELNLPPEGDDDEFPLKRARRIWRHLPKSYSLPRWRNEVFSREADCASYIQEIPHISWNADFNYCSQCTATFCVFWARLIQFTPSVLFHIRFIVIYFSLHCLDRPNGLFPSSYPIWTTCPVTFNFLSPGLLFF